MGNPQRALDAILEDETTVDGYTICPLTAARLALLERAHSPLITNKSDVDGMMMSFYILTQPIDKLAGKDIGQICTDAYIWGDKLDVGGIEKLADAMKKSIADIKYLAPGDGEDDGKKKLQTAG